MLKVYRVKDTFSGEYYNGKGEFSKGGKLYRNLGALKQSLNLTKERMLRYRENMSNKGYQAWKEYAATVTKWFPDNWIIIEEIEGITICTVNELMEPLIKRDKQKKIEQEQRLVKLREEAERAKLAQLKQKYEVESVLERVG